MCKTRSVKSSTTAVYTQIGGLDTLRLLADAFYSRIEQDRLLRPMFPTDLVRPRERQAHFLAAVFGGPNANETRHSKARLGCIHAHFPIGPEDAEAWLSCMLLAIDQVGIAEPGRTIMRKYFETTAPTLADPLLRYRHLAADPLRVQLHADPSLVHRQDGNGSTLLHAAAGAWDIERVTLLLELGASVDIGTSPLCHVARRYVSPAERAADSGRIVSEMLLRRGAEANTATGPEAQTPLHMAARRGNTAVARALLKGGAVLEVRDKKGETPLRRAVNCGHVELATLLLAHGADVNSRDSQGQTPLRAARRPDMKVLLLEHGAAE